MIYGRVRTDSTTPDFTDSPRRSAASCMDEHSRIHISITTHRTTIPFLISIGSTCFRTWMPDQTLDIYAALECSSLGSILRLGDSK